MKVALLIVVLTSSMVSLQRPTGSPCGCLASKEATRAGANENVVIVESRKYRHLEGVVRDEAGQILPDVLVEVFDKPDYLLLRYPESEEKKRTTQVCSMYRGR